MHWLLRGFAGLGLVVVLAAGCSGSSAGSQQVFVTAFGLGPDKWATAWLLTHHAAPGARLVVIDSTDQMPEGIAFDVPDAQFRRVGNRAAFEVVRDAYSVDDPDIERLSAVVHDIEVNFWSSNRTAEAQLVEQAFRALQRGQAHGTVTPECYITFFESVYRAMRTQRTQDKAMSMGDLSVTCKKLALDSSADSLVPEIEIPDLLAEMKRGKSVVFVDVREADEFAEAHIPGAINITLRDLGKNDIDNMKHADYVVSYCVKDFRGFEMAKALRQSGVGNAVILRPYGMKGWLSQGLPMIGTEALEESKAMAEMSRCIDSSGHCLKTTKLH